MMPGQMQAQRAAQIDPLAGVGQTILVTGGSGFLARWCLVELARRGYALRTTVRDPAAAAGLTAMLRAQLSQEYPLNVLTADLSSEAGWSEAVEGCDAVLHTASPFPAAAPRDPDEIIVPATEGTRRVLRAALRAGVSRIVVTSSSSAVATDPRPDGAPVTEGQWADPSQPGIRAYVRSKTLAEQAAWDLAREAGAEQRLAVVAPATLLGPVLGGRLSYSVTAVDQMLHGFLPGLPRLGFSFADVRDVAGLHLLAMTSPAAAGERFLGSGPFLWLTDVAAILRRRLGLDAGRVPTRQLPDLLVRVAARFSPGLRQVSGDLGRRVDFSAEKARTVLGWSPRPVEDTIADCGRSLLPRSAPAVAALVGAAAPV
jgi:dihydroflavonol-4-reductase